MDMNGWKIINNYDLWSTGMILLEMLVGSEIVLTLESYSEINDLVEAC